MNVYGQLADFCPAGQIPEGASLMAILDADGLKVVSPVSVSLLDDESENEIVVDHFSGLLEARRLQRKLISEEFCADH